MGRRWIYQRKGTTSTELKYAAWDVNMGMVFSNMVMYVIILATGATFFKAGQNNIQTAADAAFALRPLAGAAATVLFALGIIGAGFLAVPVLAGSSAYAVSEAFGWVFGLSKDLVRAPQFYGIIATSMLVGMEINFLGINPITAGLSHRNRSDNASRTTERRHHHESISPLLVYQARS